MITNAFRMRRSEYVLGRPRGRLAGAGGQGRWSMSSTRLTRRLIWRSISVPPQCGCVVTEILRGQLCCDDAWHGCFIYDHVSINCLEHFKEKYEAVKQRLEASFVVREYIQPVILVGPRAVGKTSLLVQWHAPWDHSRLNPTQAHNTSTAWRK